MKRLEFDSEGNLISIDKKQFTQQKPQSFYEIKREVTKNFSEEDWDLHENGKNLLPLKFSNGKSQADIVNEVVSLIKKGKKLIFIHGTCGTGKSAIALNIARQIGKASIVVPIKSLQKQYEQDYLQRKYILKKNKEKMKIEVITGRDNHDSVIEFGKTCADPFLPDTIAFSEKNTELLKKYHQQNPFISKHEGINVRKLKRIAVAPANPYWSPIVNSDYELKQLKDATWKRYKGLNGKEFIFYHRKKGCSYYDQYQSYIDADVIIFNSAKYKIETMLDRKPATDIEIIDEADEFLDSLSNQEEINLTRLAKALNLVIGDEFIDEPLNSIMDLLKLEEKNKRVLGINEDDLFHIKDTKLAKIIGILLSSNSLMTEISLDELNYANKLVELSRNFEDFIEDTYVTFRKKDEDIYASLATTNISKKFNEMIRKNKAFVFMSGTLHSPTVLEHIFGVKDYAIVEAEGKLQGTVEIHRTGKEFDCRYEVLKSEKKTSEYQKALSACVAAAKKPVLIHVNAFKDLPKEEDVGNFGIYNLISREKLKASQFRDKLGMAVLKFRDGSTDNLFTTKCSRGIDFPGETCNSVIFTKYPNPNLKDTFWKVLKQTHPNYFWEFYRDKARRDFLQKLYRAVRSKDDHVYVLSPDSRVLDAVKELQLQMTISEPN